MENPTHTFGETTIPHERCQPATSFMFSFFFFLSFFFFFADHKMDKMVIEGEKGQNLLGDIFRIYNILLIKFCIQYTRATSYICQFFHYI